MDLAGVDTIETVLLYHVVPGKTLTSSKVLKADGAKLMTAAGETVKAFVALKNGFATLDLDVQRLLSRAA